MNLDSKVSCFDGINITEFFAGGVEFYWDGKLSKLPTIEAAHGFIEKEKAEKAEKAEEAEEAEKVSIAPTAGNRPRQYRAPIVPTKSKEPEI